MEYNDELAIQIVSQHNLSQKTINVWKTRGRIPDRYTPSYQKPKKIGGKKLEKFKIVFQNEKFNLKMFAKSADVNYSMLIDLWRKNKTIQQADYIQMKANLNRLRIEIKELVNVLIDEKSAPERKTDRLKQFLIETKEIKPSKLLDKNALDLKNKPKLMGSNLDHYAYADKLAIFVLETSLK